MLRRGFTLIELIVAISLVVAMTALIAPMLSEVLRDRAEESALRDLRSAFALAREDARRLDEPVRLVALVSPTGEVELRAALLGREGSMAVDGSAGLGGPGLSAASEMPPGASGRPAARGPGFTEPRSIAGLILSLPARLWIRRVEVESSRLRVVEDPLASSEWWGVEPVDEVIRPEPGSSLTLAIFLPDGSALGSAPLELCGRSGVVAELTVNPWTGELLIERRARGARAGAGVEAGSTPTEFEAADGPDDGLRPGGGA
ncbi:MAG: prepilin-type N-terminal cleavage/methylation domain-containing protein [Phycisphaeraceae bacterium]|nr:prepilin-type N-terminal cleavage/methylation domain-containing protein [Phycisphaeraceae bacterium]